MKGKLLEYAIIAVVILWIAAFFWIFSISRHCSQSGAITTTQGVCLWRRIAGISCIFGLELAFGVGAGLQSKARGYPFIMGFLLGFFLNALGGFFVMTLSPKGTPSTPVPRKNKVLLFLVLMALILFAVLLSMKNRGVF